jgi:hypothetical protein
MAQRFSHSDIEKTVKDFIAAFIFPENPTMSLREIFPQSPVTRIVRVTLETVMFNPNLWGTARSSSKDWRPKAY